MEISELSKLEQQSKERGIPILGNEKGEWLLQKIKEHKPKKILELGTANGYSGCILGSEGAELTTIEIDNKISEEAMVNFAKHDVNAKIIMGDGVEVTKEIAESEKFDLIFIDFFKKGYLQVLESCIKMLNSNGVLIADNISMQGCKDFKEAVLKDKRLQTKIIEIKDGLSYSKKL